MINCKKIFNSILSDSRITSIIDEDSIFDAYPSIVETFPCIIFIEKMQMETEYADNISNCDICSVQIHIFTKSEIGFPTTTEIGLIINKVFKENDFTCTTNTDIIDDEYNVRHRVMEFSKEFFPN